MTNPNRIAAPTLTADTITADEIRALQTEASSVGDLNQIASYARRTARGACECGAWSGEPCAAADCAATDLVVVEWMPSALRASHEAAGSTGRYPANGAERIRVTAECALGMLATDGDWCAIVE